MASADGDGAGDGGAHALFSEAEKLAASPLFAGGGVDKVHVVDGDPAHGVVEGFGVVVGAVSAFGVVVGEADGLDGGGRLEEAGFALGVLLSPHGEGEVVGDGCRRAVCDLDFKLDGVRRGAGSIDFIDLEAVVGAGPAEVGFGVSGRLRDELKGGGGFEARGERLEGDVEGEGGVVRALVGLEVAEQVTARLVAGGLEDVLVEGPRAEVCECEGKLGGGEEGGGGFDDAERRSRGGGRVTGVCRRNGGRGRGRCGGGGCGGSGLGCLVAWGRGGLGQEGPDQEHRHG